MRVVVTLRDGEVPEEDRVEVIEEALRRVESAVRGRVRSMHQRGPVYNEGGAVVGGWEVVWGPESPN